jgi:ubiquinone/menaquinone biosynthesis C-methylase UbiE
MLNEKQYATPANFNARVNLNGKFRTNPESWNHWLFKHLPAGENLKILDLGCGTGLFWHLNRSQTPASWQITLTDYSPGMLEAARQNLGETPFPCRFETVNAEELPYEEASFDIIIANLMLYPLKSRDHALQGISRVLKPGGLFIAPTFGGSNMFELNHLLDTYLEKIAKTNSIEKIPFPLKTVMNN